MARWNRKTESIGDGGPALPYPSQVVLYLSGSRSDCFMARSLSTLIAHCPDEVPFDMGAARCKSLDSEFYDSFAERTGRRPKSLEMEASWIATDEAIHYVTPKLAAHRRWSWEDAFLEPLNQRKRRSTMRIVSERDSWRISMSTSAMANALAIASWAADR